MTQDEFNLRILTLLDRTIHELRRSTKSQDWDDMETLRQALTMMAGQLPVKATEV
jgi:hypothetical protein